MITTDDGTSTSDSHSTRASAVLTDNDSSSVTRDTSSSSSSSSSTADQVSIEIQDLNAGSALDEDTASESIQDVELMIYGMTCTSCSNSIESHLTETKGIRTISVTLSTEKARITYDSSVIGVREIIKCIEDMGFDATLPPLNADLQAESLKRIRERLMWWRLFLVSVTFCVPEFLLSHVLVHFSALQPFYRYQIAPGFYLVSLIDLLLTLPVLCYAGRHFIIGSWKAFRHGSATMDVLVSSSTLLSFTFSIFTIIYASTHPSLFNHGPPKTFFETTTMLLTFVTLGKYLESIAKGKTSSALAALYESKPTTALLVKVDPETNAVLSEENISAELIQRGDIVKVLPGEKIPVDGTVIDGKSHVSRTERSLS
jgi:Cu+-exporting ATPase